MGSTRAHDRISQASHAPDTRGLSEAAGHGEQGLHLRAEIIADASDLQRFSTISITPDSVLRRHRRTQPVGSRYVLRSVSTVPRGGYTFASCAAYCRPATPRAPTAPGGRLQPPTPAAVPPSLTVLPVCKLPISTSERPDPTGPFAIRSCPSHRPVRRSGSLPNSTMTAGRAELRRTDCGRPAAAFCSPRARREQRPR